MFYAGIDVGSLTAETVIIDEKGAITIYNILPTGSNARSAAERSFSQALEGAGLMKEDITEIVATGYGRSVIDFAPKKITEITCHARGAIESFPETRTIIDIGGQDSKVIRVGKAGKVMDFAMNDKCAAGTGRFLEVMARALEVKLTDMEKLSALARSEISISSICTVFAESEVVSLIASGEPVENIIAGLHRSVANRVNGMVRRVGLEEAVTMTGGVAKNKGVIKALEDVLGVHILVPKEPQINGALGAALLALEKHGE